MTLLKETNEIMYKIIGSCMEAYKVIGPGFPVDFYKKALEIEFAEKELKLEILKSFPYTYKGTEIGTVQLDYVVDKSVIVVVQSYPGEIHDVEIHQAVRYLALAGCPIGLLVNFGNTKIMYKRILPTRQNKEPRKEDTRPLGYRPVAKTMREGNIRDGNSRDGNYRDGNLRDGYNY
ncbi:MAG TPA: GxxExxY protein [bacterium]